MFGIGIVCQTAHSSERVIHVTGPIVVNQRLVTTEGGSDSDLLRPPIEVHTDRICRENHERAHASVCVVNAASMRIASGRGAEREEAWPVSTVAADREFCLRDNA